MSPRVNATCGRAYTSGQLLLTVRVAGSKPVAPPPPHADHPHWAASATPEGDGHCAFAFTAVNPLAKVPAAYRVARPCKGTRAV